MAVINVKKGGTNFTGEDLEVLREDENSPVIETEAVNTRISRLKVRKIIRDKIGNKVLWYIVAPFAIAIIAGLILKLF